MKKLSVLLIVLFELLVVHIQAKTIHWLTFIDTTDSNVGKIDINTHDILYARWIDLVNATLNEEGYNINVIDIYGNETSPEKCKEVLNRLQCKMEDIVIFYYVGHGTENTNTSKYPLMWMAQHDINKCVPLSWVHETLKKKGARLTITIGMCCNARQGMPGRVEPSFSINYGNTYIDPEMSESIRKMFLKHQGDLIVSSASPAESSWACDSPLGPTDYFTLSLIMQFNNILPTDWESMMREIKDEVYYNVQSDKIIQQTSPGTTQTPVWDNNLTAFNGVVPPQPPDPNPNINPGLDEKTMVKTGLNKMFAYVSSTSVDDMKRIAAVENIKKMFSGDLIVRIIAQDGNVVVDKENLSTFLGRISTSRLLMNVSVADLNVNDEGLITSLRVREVYKK